MDNKQPPPSKDIRVQSKEDKKKTKPAARRHTTTSSSSSTQPVANEIMEKVGHITGGDNNTGTGGAGLNLGEKSGSINGGTVNFYPPSS